MDLILLPPRSLMNMLCEAYKSDEPITTLRNLLQPYSVTFDQVHAALGSAIFWPGRLSANEAHPFYVTMQKFLEYQRDMDTTAKIDYFKRRFVYVATSVAHAWYTRQRETDYKFVLHRDPHFVAYQYPGCAAPYAWFSFDKFGMPHVFAAHTDMPPVEIELMRSTKAGDLLPLTLKFFEVVAPRGGAAGGNKQESPPAAVATQATSRLQFHVHNQHFLQLHTFPSNTRTYVLFFSEDLLLTRCIMVSPTTDRAWSIPVVMHQYE